MLFAVLSAACARGQTPLQLVQLNAAQIWRRVEFRVDNVPPASNPFDPDSIRLDATFILPSGRTNVVPAFWYQGYQRTLQNGSEQVTAAGTPEWQVRYTPTESGEYAIHFIVLTNGQPYGAMVTTRFTVSNGAPAGRFGFVRAAGSKEYFETGDGSALPLVGANVCWPGGRGTYDYDDWFSAMHSAGENYARIWMCPWAFGLETDSGSLTRYRLDRAWQLDYVFSRAEQFQIYLLLCLDYHGMFATEPDIFGGNNFWPNNPYNAGNGGPCGNQNSFFTNSAARTIYQKRLRYLTARYGYSQNLLAWEFFNEIDNVYQYLDPTAVAAWHGVMGDWLHANDAFGHLVTTSLTGGSDRSEIWSLPQLDFAAYHSYNEPSPATRLATVAQSFLSRYRKPVMIGEFGVDYRGWSRPADPYLRGLRQGLWGGALGGSAGTAMSWWWENLNSENVYPLYEAFGSILNRTHWSAGAWKPIGFQTSGAPPSTVGSLLTNGQPFTAQLMPGTQWGGKPSGQLAIPNPGAAGYAASTLNSFVHGMAHPDLRVPFRLSAWLTNDARLVLHLNSVSDGAILTVRVDGTEIYRTNLVNLDGGYSVNNEYNADLPVNVPAGNHLVEVRNAGGDWFYLDWVRLEQVLPATYPGGWTPSPDAVGLRGGSESLLYVIAPGASFPAGATNVTLPLQQNKSVTLTNWPAGTFLAQWFDPATGQRLSDTQSTATNGIVTLPLPDFREDLAGAVYPPPFLTAVGDSGAGNFQFRLDSEPGGQYVIDRSADLSEWTWFLTVTNITGTWFQLDTAAATNDHGFFRARRNN
jgi:hypothetical protein